jgi:hypothetical protein
MKLSLTGFDAFHPDRGCYATEFSAANIPELIKERLYWGEKAGDDEKIAPGGDDSKRLTVADFGLCLNGQASTD